MYGRTYCNKMTMNLISLCSIENTKVLAIIGSGIELPESCSEGRLSSGSKLKIRAMLREVTEIKHWR